MQRKTLVLFLVLACLAIGNEPVFAAQALFPSEPPPMFCWGPAKVVDEPEGAFYSLGLTLHHLARQPENIAAFHDWLKQRGMDVYSTSSRPVAVPAECYRILIDPELGAQGGWKVKDGWLVSSKGHRGPQAKFPLTVPQTGLYRIWIRYVGYTNATAVTHLTLQRKNEPNEPPMVYEEFNTRPAPEEGPMWHEFGAELPAGDYTATLGHVVRYFHAPEKMPFQEHRVDCIYLTDAIWEDAPSDSLLQSMRAQAPEEMQKVQTFPLDAKGRAVWALWKVRPVDWQDAEADDKGFRAGYAFWRSRVDAIAAEDWNAGPEDPVKKGVPDYREPRRQVVFEPAWNMAGNPHHIQRQAEALAGDVDPEARDMVLAELAPGMFPVVTGQWQRSGGGLSADHAARNGLAMGSYLAPHSGEWHVWVQFKNINYFEYFGMYADTVNGRDAVWERTERNYPGGRAAWAKVGVAVVPDMDEQQKAEYRDKARTGVFVKNGKPVFAYLQGDWASEQGASTNTGKGALMARAALKKNADFIVKARLSLRSNPTNNGAVFFFKDENGLQENTLALRDFSLKGPSVGELLSNAGLTLPEEGSFVLEIERNGKVLKVRLNGAEALATELKAGSAGGFGFRQGASDLQVLDFSAAGGLDDGLEMAQSITLCLWMDKYINPRTYRGVYKVMLTDDPEYKPEGNLSPRISPARYLADMQAIGATPERGYAMNVATGVGVFNQTWMPRSEPQRPALDFAMARNADACGRMVFRNVLDEQLVLSIDFSPLQGRGGSYSGRLQWRAVGFVRYGGKREEWSPFLLLRRPFLGLPPRSVAGAWLNVNSSGMKPGVYTCNARVRGHTWDGSKAFPERIVTIKVTVKDVAIAPKRPILLHGWTHPPAGEIYRRDWFRRFNVWQGRFFSKEDMQKYGLKKQIHCLWNPNTNEIIKQIKTARELGLDYDDWMFTIKDEPTGTTAAALQSFITIAKMVRAADTNAVISMNPGEAARAATFRILQPYVDVWNPYQLHLSYGPSGKDYLKKPWLWYTTPCYEDKLPGISGQLYNQVRSVPAKPGDCLGTALFAPYYPWRDPWDTAYEHIRDVAVMVLPSRNGPVATPAWEALLLGVQHANIARMIRERADEGDEQARKLWEKGTPEAMLDWLEQRR